MGIDVSHTPIPTATTTDSITSTTPKTTTRSTLSLSGAISHELLHLASSITATNGYVNVGPSYNECLCVFLLSRQQVITITISHPLPITNQLTLTF